MVALPQFPRLDKRGRCLKRRESDEQRLKLWSSGLAPSLPAAREKVLHGNVLVIVPRVAGPPASGEGPGPGGHPPGAAPAGFTHAGTELEAFGEGKRLSMAEFKRVPLILDYKLNSPLGQPGRPECPQPPAAGGRPSPRKVGLCGIPTPVKLFQRRGEK